MSTQKYRKHIRNQETGEFEEAQSTDIHRVYSGETEPTDPNVEIWIKHVEVDDPDICPTNAEVDEKINKLVDGTTQVGDSAKLGGESADYYAKQSDIDNIVNGTTVVGDSKKLGGKGADYYDNNSDVCVNLLNPTLQTTTIDGVTCTNNGDGTYTLNGTATSNTWGFNFCNITLPKGVYKGIGHNPTDSDDYRVQFVTLDKLAHVGGSKDDIGNGTLITLNEETTFKVRVVVIGGRTVNNVVVKPMITNNLNATYDHGFVPYTGDGLRLNECVADNTKAISTNSFGVNSGSKNLFKPTLQNITSSGITCISNGDGTYTLNGTATSNSYGINFGNIKLPKGNYKGVGHPLEVNEDYRVQFVTLDKLAPVGGSKDDIGNGTLITLNEETTFKVRVVVLEGKTVNNVVVKPMITSDLSACYDDYEEYVMSNYQLTNNDWELIGSVTGQNNVNINSEKYKEFHVEQYVLTSTKNGGWYNNIIAKDMTSTMKRACSGYCSSSTKIGTTVEFTNTYIRNALIIWDGDDITSTSTMTVYGRK